MYHVDERLEQYLEVLDAAPVIKNNILESFDDYKIKKNVEMPNESKLYLCALAVPLLGFVEWVIKEAISDGKNRLYFLSRDGYQMYMIAKSFVEKKNIDIEVRYLNVSRFSMRLPAYKLDIEKAMDSICVGGIDVTMVTILKRAGLSDGECDYILQELDLLRDRDRILNYKEVIQFRDKLKTSKSIRELIDGYSSKVYDNAIGYLKQEGLCLDDKYALVDSGWIGTLQQSIETLVKSVNSSITITGYYFGLYDTPKSSAGLYKGYYFTKAKGLKRKSRFSNSLFETIVSAPDGMTIEYANKNDEYVALLNDICNPNDETIERNIDALGYLLERLSEPDLEISLDIIERLLDLFMARPTNIEVELYGDNLFSDDVNDGRYKKVAAELSVEDIRNQRFISKLLIIIGIKKRTIRESSWIEGSAVRAYGDINEAKKEFMHIEFYKRFVFARKQF